MLSKSYRRRQHWLKAYTIVCKEKQITANGDNTNTTEKPEVSRTIIRGKKNEEEPIKLRLEKSTKKGRKDEETDRNLQNTTHQISRVLVKGNRNITKSNVKQS